MNDHFFLQNIKMPELGAEGVINAVNARLEEDKADLMKAAIDVSEKQNKCRQDKDTLFNQNSEHFPFFTWEIFIFHRLYRNTTRNIKSYFLVQFSDRNGTFGDLGPRVDALQQASSS